MLKKYTPAHRNQAIDLFLGVFTAEPFCYDWLSRESVTRYFTDIENTPLELSFLYYNDKGLLTGLCFGIVNDYFQLKLYEIKELAIRKETQGTGEGRRMLDEISAYMKREGAAVIKLATQRNIAAYGFYLKNGFIPSETSVTLSRPI